MHKKKQKLARKLVFLKYPKSIFLHWCRSAWFKQYCFESYPCFDNSIKFMTRKKCFEIWKYRTVGKFVGSIVQKFITNDRFCFNVDKNFKALKCSILIEVRFCNTIKKWNFRWLFNLIEPIGLALGFSNFFCWRPPKVAY